MGNICIDAASIAAEVEGAGCQPVSAQTHAAHCIKLVCMAVVPEGSICLKMLHKKARKQFAKDKQTKDIAR